MGGPPAFCHLLPLPHHPALAHGDLCLGQRSRLGGQQGPRTNTVIVYKQIIILCVCMVDLGFCVLVLRKVRHAYNPVCPNHMVLKQDLHFFLWVISPFQMDAAQKCANSWTIRNISKMFNRGLHSVWPICTRTTCLLTKNANSTLGDWLKISRAESMNLFLITSPPGGKGLGGQEWQTMNGKLWWRQKYSEKLCLCVCEREAGRERWVPEDLITKKQVRWGHSAVTHYALSLI